MKNNLADKEYTFSLSKDHFIIDNGYDCHWLERTEISEEYYKAIDYLRSQWTRHLICRSTGCEGGK